VVFYQVGVVVAPDTPQLFVEGIPAELCEVSFAYFYPGIQLGFSYHCFCPFLLKEMSLWTSVFLIAGSTKSSFTLFICCPIGALIPPTSTFRHQSFWIQRQLKLRESSAHLVGLIMRRAVCDASAAFRASFV